MAFIWDIFCEFVSQFLSDQASKTCSLEWGFAWKALIVKLKKQDQLFYEKVDEQMDELLDELKCSSKCLS